MSALSFTPTSESSETYLAAAIIKKRVPVAVVTTEEGGCAPAPASRLSRAPDMRTTDGLS